MPNLLSSLPTTLPTEVTESLIQADHVRVQRIVSQGHASPTEFWYDQPENEFVLVVQGAARLQFENEEIELRRGDWIEIPAHRKHRVDWTHPGEKTIWLAVFYD
jgi:cupin 2 domain-containing protein